MKSPMRSPGKPSRTKPLPAAGALPGMSSMVGGLANRTGANPSMKKSGPTMAMSKGGKVRK